MVIQIETAMVLAAGFGKRMRVADNAPPKPLTPLAGITLLDRMLDKLKAAGIKRVIINVHHKADWLEKHIAQLAQLDQLDQCQMGAPELQLIVSDERAALLETGGGVKKALPLLGESPIFVCNSDVFWHEQENNLTAMLNQFDAQKMQALLLLAPREASSGYDGKGDFHRAENGLLTRLKMRRITSQSGDKNDENNDEDDASAPFIYAGVQIVNPALVAKGPEGAFSFNLLWDKALAEDGLYGAVLDGRWMHIGTAEGLATAEETLTSL